jgi:radical SAM superfamily enzyme YgiQ (UPF0313 family)
MDRPKIILCIPPIALETITGKLGKFWEIGSSMPPQGLCQIAAISREKGYETKILDCQVMRLTLDKAVENILEFNPKFVGISSSTVSINASGKFAKKIKEVKSSIMTIIGGPHVSALPVETLKEFNGFDVGVVGEGDLTFYELIETVLNHSGLNNVSGLLYRDNGKIRVNAPRPLIKDLDFLPMPAWDLLPKLSKYYRTSAQRSKEFPIASIITSRGCPFNCSFCDKSVFGQTLRAHSAKYVLEMIKILKYKHSIRALVFNDDLFIVNKNRLIEICEGMIQNNLKISWSCNGRLDSLDLEILKLMRRAGCWQIAFGIESSNQELIEKIKKKIYLDTIPEKLRLVKKAGISTKGFFILGLPSETIKTIEKTIEYTKKIPLDDVQFSIFTPYPGSELYKYVVENEGFIPEWDKMNTIFPSYVPKYLTKEDLIYYQRKGTKEFYFRIHHIVNQVLKFKNLRYVINVIREALYFLNYIYRN